VYRQCRDDSHRSCRGIGLVDPAGLSAAVESNCLVCHGLVSLVDLGFVAVPYKTPFICFAKKPIALIKEHPAYPRFFLRSLRCKQKTNFSPFLNELNELSGAS
jgi:hypothetical protein